MMGFNVGYIGRISPEKGIDLILRALTQINIEVPITFYIAGGIDNEYAKKLNIKFKKSAGNVTVKWLGWLNNEQRADFYNSCQVILLLSRCIENGPLTFYEAMYYKRFLIVSNTPNYKDILCSGDGYVVVKHINVRCIKYALIESYKKLQSQPHALYKFRVINLKQYIEKINDVYSEA